MFSHVMLGANDIEESKVFYDAVLGALGHKPGVMDEKGRCFYYMKQGVFALSKPIDGQPACNGNGSTLGFAVRNPEGVDAWHSAGRARPRPRLISPIVTVQICPGIISLTRSLPPRGVPMTRSY